MYPIVAREPPHCRWVERIGPGFHNLRIVASSDTSGSFGYIQYDATRVQLSK